MSREDDMLLEFIASRDADCPNCGYSVRGLERPICPECGTGLELGVVAQRVAVGPWLVAIVSLSLAAGFDGVLFIVGMGEQMFRPPMNPMIAPIVFAFGLAALIQLAWIAVLAKRRARWARLQIGTQRALAAAYFFGILIVHATVGLLIYRWF